MIIYISTNLVNGKKYIGMDRKNDPTYLGSGLYIKQAIKKYGKDNFIKEVLEVCNSMEHLLEREKFWIKYYNASEDKNFYNIHTGGQGGDITIYLSDENIEVWKQKISDTKTGRKFGPISDDKKNAISAGLNKYYENGGVAPLQGKNHSNETKNKISNSHKGKKFTEEHVNNLKDAFSKRDYNGEKNPFYGKGDTQKGDKNPMYGRSFYDVWVSKYGVERANELMQEYKDRARERNELKRKNKNNGTNIN